MDYRKADGAFALRLDVGEDIIESLKAFCTKERVETAIVSGIGAARMVEIGHFDTERKEYHNKKYEGMLEILSLSGNITMSDGEPLPHLHICIAGTDFSAVGGHLVKSEVSPTCEITIIPLGIRIERKFDGKTGLKLQSLR